MAVEIHGYVLEKKTQCGCLPKRSKAQLSARGQSPALSPAIRARVGPPLTAVKAAARAFVARQARLHRVPSWSTMGCRACWLAATRCAAMVQLSSGAASRLYRVAGMPLWRRGCASASVCSDVPLAEIIAVGLVCDDLLLVRQRKWWVTACS